MRKKRFVRRLRTVVTASILAVAVCIVPVGTNVAYAEEDVVLGDENPAEEAGKGDILTNTDKEIPKNDEEGVATDKDREEEIQTAAPETKTSDETTEELGTKEIVTKTAEVQAVNGEEPEEENFDVKLLYGDENLKDEDALVLTFLGDGFTKDQLGDPDNPDYIPDTTAASAEQKKYWNYAYTAAKYMMETSPWDEFADCIKIYGIGVISKDSGVKGCDAKTMAEAEADNRDTYFKSHYWNGGMQRGLVIDSYGREQVNKLKEKYIQSDYEVIFCNSEEVGGTGGSICVFSVDPDTYECTLHELGHTVGKLADEYWAGVGYAREYVNMTEQSDPEQVSWKRFLGKNGIGIYEYGDGGDGWYRPSQNCKMQFLGKQFPYCEVCKEGLRDKISELSNVQNIAFQLYADDFYQGDELPDMSEYFILRKGAEKKTLQEIDKDDYMLTYYKEDGMKLDSQPTESGTYKVKAEFKGNTTFDKCELTGTYKIGLPNALTITAASKKYDGSPANVKCDVDADKLGVSKTDIEIKLHYTGADKFAIGESGTYDSDEAPLKPGEYTVTAQAYQKGTNTMLAEKSQAFTISFEVNTVVNHEDGLNYPGAYSYYNNKTIPILGEGFTEKDQDKFKALADELIRYMRNREPYKETDLYFNYTTVATISDNSGIGENANGTYFQLIYDENGKITPTVEQATAAHSVAYEQANHYYQSVIVIVNDEKATASAVEDPTAATSIKHRAIFITPDEAGMEFAAQEVLNRIADMDKGYVPSTDEEKSELRARLLDKIVYGTNNLYAPVLSTAYKEKFVEDGNPVNLKPYFTTYAGRYPISADTKGLDYTVTYYEDDNGEPGKEISAPSKPGIYWALAVTVANDTNRRGLPCATGLDLSSISGYSENTTLFKTRGLTQFTIVAAEDNNDPSGGNNSSGGNTNPSNPNQTISGQNGNNGSNSGKAGTAVNKTSKKSLNKTAKTGDTANVLPLAVTALAALAVIAGIIYYKRKRIL